MTILTNPNRPHPGSTIKTEPIRHKKDIDRIKKILAGNPRDLTIFIVGINTNLKPRDLLSLTVGKGRSMKVGDAFEDRDKKHTVTVNPTVLRAIQDLLADMPAAGNGDYLFQSNKKERGGLLSTATLNNLVKKWCSDIGLKGNYGSETLRKTFGYHQCVTFGVDVANMMPLFSRNSRKKAMDYLCIQESDIERLYLGEL